MIACGRSIHDRFLSQRNGNFHTAPRSVLAMRRVFSCARALGGGDGAAHAGAIALGLCTCGASLNLMCCFMRLGEFGMARGRAQPTQSILKAASCDV